MASGFTLCESIHFGHAWRNTMLFRSIFRYILYSYWLSVLMLFKRIWIFIFLIIKNSFFKQLNRTRHQSQEKLALIVKHTRQMMIKLWLTTTLTAADMHQMRHRMKKKQFRLLMIFAILEGVVRSLEKDSCVIYCGQTLK